MYNQRMATLLLFSLFLVTCIAVDTVRNDDFFDPDTILAEDFHSRRERAPDYGAGLGGPLAAMAAPSKPGSHPAPPPPPPPPTKKPPPTVSTKKPRSHEKDKAKPGSHEREGLSNGTKQCRTKRSAPSDFQPMPSDDFADVENEIRSRDERSPDYGAGLGGPLAASSFQGKLAPKPLPAPAPLPAPPPEPGRLKLGQRLLNRNRGGEQQQQNAVPKVTPAPAQGPVTAPAPPPGHEATPPPVSNQCKVRSPSSVSGPHLKCEYESKTKKMLADIRDGKSYPPDYAFLGSYRCDSDEKCQEICDREGCNHYLRYVDSCTEHTADLYLVDDDVLKDAQYVDSKEYDSTTQKCRIQSTNNAHDQSHKGSSSHGKKVSSSGSSTGTDVHKRSKRQFPPIDFCGTCLSSPFGVTPVCSFICKGGMLGIILGVSIGVGVGVGVGAGVPLAMSQQASAQAAAQASAQAAAQQAAAQQQVFNQFQQTWQKSYDTPQQQQQAQQNYQQNQQNMQQSNQNCHHDDARQGDTKFSDMTFGTFAAFYMGAMTGPVQPVVVDEMDPGSLERPHNQTTLKWGGGTAPSSSGAVGGGGGMPKIRYQGKCGSCYAFTTADLVASQHSIERGLYNRKQRGTEELSVQYIIDCGGENASYGCTGGRPVMVMKNIEASEGVPFESCYPYKEQAGKCNVEAAKKCCQRQKVKWSQLINVSGKQEKEIIAKLLNWGPMVAIVGANEAWQFYNGSGVIKAKQCDPSKQNHAVIVAGYNFDGPTPYYLIRNSWGPDWGINGYAKLEAGVNACNVAKTLLVTCTGDCRNVTHVKDLIHRVNYPSKKKSSTATHEIKKETVADKKTSPAKAPESKSAPSTNAAKPAANSNPALQTAAKNVQSSIADNAGRRS